MGRGKRPYRRIFVVVVAAGAALWMACDSGDDTTFNRVSEKGGGPADGGEVDATVDEPDASAADAADEDAIVDAGVDAMPPTTFVTGSSPHPLPAIGWGDHTCVVAGAERAVYCWGSNDHGQLGNGGSYANDAAPDVSTAAKIATDENGLIFAGIDELAASGFHNCARRGDLVFCWGERFSGSQADPPANPASDRTKPRAIGNLPTKAIGAGGAHTCVLKTNNKVTCFGHSYFNELGRARAVDPACTSPLFYDFVGVADHTCSADLLETPATLMAPTAVVAGEVHSCVLSDGRVHCWGNNTYAQLGVPGGQVGELNAQTVATEQVNMTPLDQVRAIASGGGNHTCALRAGKVLCWGLNRSGELGFDPATLLQRPNAVEVPGITDATAIGAADGVTCAVRSGGAVWCWGAAESGQIGDAGTAFDGGVVSFTPVQIKGPGGVGNLTDVVAIAPGRRHVCARKVDNSVWCWGKNDRGQLGDGSKVDSIYPVKVTGLP